MYPRNMVCFRYIVINTLHKGDGGDDVDDDDDDDVDMKLRLNFMLFVKVLHVIQNVDVIKFYRFYSKYNECLTNARKCYIYGGIARKGVGEMMWLP